MCHFVTAVLPAASAIDAIDTIAQRHGRRLSPLSNPGIKAQLDAGERYFLLASGHCDCGTPLGALASKRGTRAPDVATEAKRLRKKGWSESKIARSLAQAREHQEADAASKDAAHRDAVISWIRLIRDILSSGHTPSLGLLLHFYDGRLDASFRLLSRDSVPASELTDATLLGMNEDVLYLFQR